MSRIDPSRQVSIDAARACFPAFTEGRNMAEVFEKLQNSGFSRVEGEVSLYIPCRGSLYIHLSAQQRGQYLLLKFSAGLTGPWSLFSFLGLPPCHRLPPPKKIASCTQAALHPCKP